MSIRKATGELTGREFGWGILAGLAGSVIGDVFSSNAANSAQQQAEQNANQQSQEAFQQQVAYINQAEQNQRAAIQGVASQGNPFLQAGAMMQRPNPNAYTTPGTGGQVFSGGQGIPNTVPPEAVQRAYQGGQNFLAPSGPPQQPGQQIGQHMLQPVQRMQMVNRGGSVS